MTLASSAFGVRTHALYVVLIAFGLERLVDGAYGVWFSVATGVELKHPANVIVLLAVVMWGARLFWSATNIERYTKRADIPEHVKSVRVVRIHLPILMGQSAVFFWVCESYRTSVVPLLVGQPVAGASAEHFAFLVAVSLVYNSVWLIALVWPVAPTNAPEVLWAANNMLFATLICVAAVAIPHIPPPDASYAVLVYGGLLLINSVADFAMTGKIYLES